MTNSPRCSEEKCLKQGEQHGTSPTIREASPRKWSLVKALRQGFLKQLLKERSKRGFLLKELF